MRYSLLGREKSITMWLCCFAVVTIITFVVAAVVDDQARKSSEQERSLVQRRVRATTTGALNTAIYSVRRLESFLVSRFDTVPDISAPANERIAGQVFPELAVLASQLLTAANPVVLLYSFPGAALAQVFPSGAVGGDLLNSTLRDSVLYSAATGNILVESPRVVNGSNGIIIRVPIYNSSTEFIPSVTWWGNAVGSVAADKMVELMQQRDGTIAGTAWNVRITMGLGVSGVVMIDERLTNPEPPTGPAAFVDIIALSANSTWVYEYWDLSPNVIWLDTWYRIVVLALVPIAVSTVVVAWANVVFAMAMREYSGADHAPKNPPMAIATIGIAHASELWVMCPDVLLDAEDRLHQRVLLIAEAHRAYVSRATAQHSYTLVTRSIDAAIHLSFTLVEDLERNPIMMELSGSGRKTSDHSLKTYIKPLQVVCTVHWCKDVQVACDKVDNDHMIFYEGRSVLFASRLYSYAIARNDGGQVLISRDTWELAKGMRGVSTSFYDEVHFRQMLIPQEVFSITDPGSELMQKAAITAKIAAATHRDYIAHAILDRSSNDELAAMRDATEDAFQVVQPQRSVNSSDRDRVGLPSRENPYLFPEITQEHKNMFALLFEPMADAYTQYEFNDLLYLFQHYYNSFVTLLKPIAVAERDNILRKLSVLFALPQRQLLGHIAVNSVLQNLGARGYKKHALTRDDASDSAFNPDRQQVKNTSVNLPSSDTGSIAAGHSVSSRQDLGGF
jgi:hypothetical protein